MKEIGKKIRVVRQVKGFSQEYMAMRLGISQNAYSKMERGKIFMRPERIQRIAEIFEMPPTAIFLVDASKVVFPEWTRSNQAMKQPEGLI